MYWNKRELEKAGSSLQLFCENLLLGLAWNIKERSYKANTWEDILVKNEQF